MYDLRILLSLCGTIFGLLITVGTFILRSIKNVKARRIAEQVLCISNAIVPYIREAERLANFTGAEKKAYVMVKASQFALQSKIPFNEKQISDKVEELITLTRVVNSISSARKQAQIAREIKRVVAAKPWQ